MIQDIHPHSFDNTYVADQKLRADDYAFIFEDNCLLLKQENDKVSIPQKKDIEECSDEGIYLFIFT